MKIPQIIIGLNGLTPKTALALTKKLRTEGVMFAVNDLLDDEGVKIISKLNSYGEVMSDAKFYDKPQTVGRRVAKHARMNPKFITVLASGGTKMLQEAVKNCGQSKILAVTVLTSTSEAENKRNFGYSIEDRVLQQTNNAINAGVHGIVCPATMLKILPRISRPHSLIKVTPGIRPEWYSNPNDDQIHKVTPSMAALQGADYIVVSGPVVESDDPIEAIRQIKAEMEKAIKQLT